MRQLLLLLSFALLPWTALAAAERGEAPPPGERSGVDVGVIQDIMPVRGGFVLKSDKGHVRTYVPHWRGGMPKDGGGLDPEIVEQVRALSVGDRVELKWEWEERFRVVKLRREGGDKPRHDKPAWAGKPEHGKPEHGKPEHDKPEHFKPEPERHPLADQLEAPPTQTQGWVKGTVVRADPKGLLILKDEAGAEHRFVPHWRGGMPKDGGGFDQAMVQCVAKLQPGQTVKVRWEWEERPRLAELTY